jgi:hypothetical protein
VIDRHAATRKTCVIASDALFMIAAFEPHPPDLLSHLIQASRPPNEALHKERARHLAAESTWPSFFDKIEALSNRQSPTLDRSLRSPLRRATDTPGTHRRRTPTPNRDMLSLRPGMSAASRRRSLRRASEPQECQQPPRQDPKMPGRLFQCLLREIPSVTPRVWAGPANDNAPPP